MHHSLSVWDSLHLQSQRRNALSFKCLAWLPSLYKVSPTGFSATALAGVHLHLTTLSDQADVVLAVKDITGFLFNAFFYCVTVFLLWILQLSFCFCKSSNFVESYGLRSRKHGRLFLDFPKINVDTRYLFAPLLGSINSSTAISIQLIDNSRAFFTFLQESGSLYIPTELCWYYNSRIWHVPSWKFRSRSVVSYYDWRLYCELP